MKYKSIKILIVCISLLSFDQALCQIFSEPLSSSQFEFGYAHYWHKSFFDLQSGQSSSADTWSGGTIYIRVGAFNLLNIAVEGMVNPWSYSGKSSGNDYIVYAVGFGISSMLIDVFNLKSFFQLHYLNTMFFDKYEDKNDKQFKDFTISLPFRYDFNLSEPKLNAWLAPLYRTSERFYNTDSTYRENLFSFGIAVGLDLLLIKHLYININSIITGEIEPGFSLGFRF